MIDFIMPLYLLNSNIKYKESSVLVKNIIGKNIFFVLFLFNLLFIVNNSFADNSERVEVKAAIIQYQVQQPDAVGIDADRLEAFIRNAARNGAELVVTPETTFYRFGRWNQNGVTQLDLARSYTDLVHRFSSLAKELHISLVLGLRQPSALPLYPTFNVAIFIGPYGKILGSHRKINIADDERSFTASGNPLTDDLKVFNTPYGKTGMLICKDMDNYWQAHELVNQGMDLLIGISGDSGDGKTPGKGWQKVYNACRVGGRAYAIGANQSGANSGNSFGGGSGFVAPGGRLINTAGFGETVLYATLSLPRFPHHLWIKGPLLHPGIMMFLLE